MPARPSTRPTRALPVAASRISSSSNASSCSRSSKTGRSIVDGESICVTILGRRMRFGGSAAAKYEGLRDPFDAALLQVPSAR